jgi:hypothetical protein
MRTEAEKQSEAISAALFSESKDSAVDRLRQFAKYVSPQSLNRFLSLYEIMKKILTVQGSIIECGVYQGGGLMAWAKLSSILEPTNWRRQVIGFDTFSGFPAVHQKDAGGAHPELVKPGSIASDSREELIKLADAFDLGRPLGHIPKVVLVAGDAVRTIPDFIHKNKHLVVSLLFLDFDLYEPTVAALNHLLPRMPLGGIVVFDNVDHPYWPGETCAVDEVIGIQNLHLKRFARDPSLCYAVLGS